jgi:hypothetical protein
VAPTRDPSTSRKTLTARVIIVCHKRLDISVLVRRYRPSPSKPVSALKHARRQLRASPSRKLPLEQFILGTHEGTDYTQFAPRTSGTKSSCRQHGIARPVVYGKAVRRPKASRSIHLYSLHLTFRGTAAKVKHLPAPNSTSRRPSKWPRENPIASIKSISQKTFANGDLHHFFRDIAVSAVISNPSLL